MRERKPDKARGLSAKAKEMYSERVLLAGKLPEKATQEIPKEAKEGGPLPQAVTGGAAPVPGPAAAPAYGLPPYLKDGEEARDKKKPWRWSKYETGRHHNVKAVLKNYKRRSYEKKFPVPGQWGDDEKT
jgi:hypothetical protein